MFWFYVLPLGFLLTQYTITGFDSSAHISEETHGAVGTAAKGVWRSIFYSALIGWVLLLAITFAAPTDAVNKGGGGALASSRAARCARLGRARPRHLHRRPAVLRHGLPDQRLAMCYAFSATARSPAGGSGAG